MPDESSDVLQARRHVHELCAAGQPAEALRYAEQVDGHPFETEQLLAITELDAGEQLADRDIIARGVARFEQLEASLDGEPFAYNRANGRLALWQVAVARLGVAHALAVHRADLQQARDLYLAWTTVEPETPTRRHAARLSQHASFHDSLLYARWGVATGLSVNALAAATNVLDKVASVTQLYLRTGRKPSHVYFRGFWLLPPKKNAPDRPDPVIAEELDGGNLGLLALCDLAGELERPTPLNELITRRHAATHRTVAVHHMLLKDVDDEGWLDRITADDLREALLAQLARARAALVYLADLINDREQRLKPDGPTVSLPAWPAEPERADDW